MKVDLGTCAACGAKNSKFVESCYKCGAALPWAPNYVAPTPQKSQNTSAQVTPQASPKPKTVPQSVPPTNSNAKTVVSPPLDPTVFDNKQGSSRHIPTSISESVSRRVTIPTWAIGAGVLGCVALGMILVMAFGNRNSSAPAIIPASVPSATPAPTTIAVATTAPNPSGAAPTEVPTVISTPSLTASPAATTAPAIVPTTAPTIEPTAAVSTAPVAQNGPTFDVLYANTTSGTKEQKQAYWKTVENTKVFWRGDFVSLGADPFGPLKMRCKTGNNSILVTVVLSTTPPQSLPPMQPNQSITVEGILKTYSAQGYELSQGRVS